MLTIFTTPKPFEGHVGVIQRNAIGSWAHLHPECEVILLGDEPGAAEMARELGVRYEPGIRRNEWGTPLLDSIFSRAQQIASYDLLCYVNCDIVLLPCFTQALAAVRSLPKLLMVGRRWDVPLTQPICFEERDWEARLRELAARSGQEQLPYAVDYFLFRRGLYRDVPPLAVGRRYWDHWLVWKARSTKVPVIDASTDVLALHQNHDHAYDPAGPNGAKSREEMRRNRALAGGQLHLYTIDHATHRLVNGRIEGKRGRWHAPCTFFVRTYASQLWYWALKASYTFRHAVGLHRSAASQEQRRVRSASGE